MAQQQSNIEILDVVNGPAIIQHRDTECSEWPSNNPTSRFRMQGNGSAIIQHRDTE